MHLDLSLPWLDLLRGFVRFAWAQHIYLSREVKSLFESQTRNVLHSIGVVKDLLAKRLEDTV